MNIKSKTMTIKLSPEERSLIETAAKEAGLVTSSWARYNLLKTAKGEVYAK